MRPSRAAGAAIKEIALKGRRAQYSYLEKVAESCCGADAGMSLLQENDQVAVLYRDNESAIPLIDRLERKGIPYRMRSMDMTFFTHRIVLDIQNIIRFAANPTDIDIFMEIYYKINLYMNRQNAQRFCEISRQRGIPVLEAALRYGSFQPYQKGNLKAMATHLTNLLQESGEKAIDRIVKFMGYGDYLERMSMDPGKIFILKSIAAGEPSAEAFLERLAHLQQRIREKENDPGCTFILSTIHGSKGLEYDKVYLLDVADGIFPESVPVSMKYADIKEKETYEEERRLFYVAVTRAKEELYLFGLPNKSTFCSELLEKKPGACRTGDAVSSYGGEQSSKPYTSQPKRNGKKRTRAEYESFLASLREGTEVHHKKYGFGVVTEVNAERVTIQFAEDNREFLQDILFQSGLLEITD